MAQYAYTRTVVRLPERALSEALLDFAAPLLQTLGSNPTPEKTHRAIEVAIEIWNAHVLASPHWGKRRTKPLAAVRKAMCGKQTSPELAQTFELLSERWRTHFSLDPRLVGQWSVGATAVGQLELICETALPDGVEAHVPPPIEKRVAIGGTFLDEVQIRLTATSLLSFPLKNHCGEIGADGVVRIHSKMPTVVALFANGYLKAVGGAPVDVMVAGKKLGPMVLTEVGCAENGGHHDVAVLTFRRAP